MVDQLQCDSCLESSDAQNAHRVSLATPPKLWQALKVGIFVLEQRKGFFALFMDAACRRVHAFWKGIFGSVSNSKGATLISHLANDWMQHYAQFQFLTSDLGGCFVSNELREGAGVRGIGLLTAPGEFHGLTANVENLIRVIKRVARKLAFYHQELTLASCVSLRLEMQQQTVSFRQENVKLNRTKIMNKTDHKSSNHCNWILSLGFMFFPYVLVISLTLESHVLFGTRI